MKVNKYLLPILFIVVLLGGVGIAQAIGLWTTSGRDVVMTDDEGNPDPEGIKGWMTLEQVSATYGVPLDVLYQKLGVPAETSPQTALKDLEAIVPGFEIDLARTAVAEYLGGADSSLEPAPAPSVTPIPAEPAPASSETVAPTAEPTPAHTPEQGDGTGADRPTSTPLPAGVILPAAEIKGRMTMREVADQCAVPLEYLYEKLGIAAAEDPSQPVKDVMARYGLEIDAVRAVVAEYQGQHQP